MASDISHQRDLGVALARAALRRRDVLPLFGSSELEMNVPDRASEFFRYESDGFTVCPMGRRGASPLLLVEKAVALDQPPASGKAVVLLSQTWFLAPSENLENYAGNFSALQGLEVIYRAPISSGLRRDIALRMLDYPETLSGTPILDQGVRAASQLDSATGRLSYALLLPLGLMETTVMEMQDHFESVREVLTPAPTPSSAPTYFGMKWNGRVAGASAHSPVFHEFKAPDLASVWRGVSEMPASTEWKDLDLMLRTFQEMHVNTLLLDIPWSASHYDQLGVNATIRDKYYYSRLRAVSATYQVALANFQDHEYDANFLNDPHSHPSAKGWAFFNRDIDAFWHGLPLPDH